MWPTAFVASDSHCGSPASSASGGLIPQQPPSLSPSASAPRAVARRGPHRGIGERGVGVQCASLGADGDPIAGPGVPSRAGAGPDRAGGDRQDSRSHAAGCQVYVSPLDQVHYRRADGPACAGAERPGLPQGNPRDDRRAARAHPRRARPSRCRCRYAQRLLSKAFAAWPDRMRISNGTTVRRSPRSGHVTDL